MGQERVSKLALVSDGDARIVQRLATERAIYAVVHSRISNTWALHSNKFLSCVLPCGVVRYSARTFILATITSPQKFMVTVTSRIVAP
jgi:hypothetical protein